VHSGAVCAAKGEAVEAEAKGRLEARQTLRPVVDTRITVAQYAERWLAVVQPSLKPRSLAGYREKLDNHLLPTLGEVQIRHLHRGRLRKFLSEKLATGLSSNTVRPSTQLSAPC
jgi:hypothetical protein